MGLELLTKQELQFPPEIALTSTTEKLEETCRKTLCFAPQQMRN